MGVQPGRTKLTWEDENFLKPDEEDGPTVQQSALARMWYDFAAVRAQPRRRLWTGGSAVCTLILLGPGVRAVGVAWYCD